MRPSDVKRTLAALLPAGRAIWLWGQPGVAKSQLVAQTAAELGVGFLDWRALLRDPVDGRGVPSIVDGRTRWNPPIEFPDTGRGIFFLDEVAQAPVAMQQVCGSLALERGLGEYRLPSGWWVVAASNRPDDQAGTIRTPANVLDRFVHLDVEADLSDWQAWAATAGIRTEVRAFLNYRPALLHSWDPRQLRKLKATPRSWHTLSDLLPLTPPDLLLPTAAGIVGENVAPEFVAFAELNRQLPDLDRLLTRPDTAAVPREPAILYALAGALAEKARTADASLLTNFVTYVGRLPEEFGVLAMRDAAAVRPQLLTSAAGWLRTHREVLLAR
jgi:MoxR-like ATPase